jgi:hypothetical protein
MTHSIGSDTTNVSVNMPKAERATLGRIACNRDQSISRTIRDLVVAALTREDGPAARAIRQARIHHRERLLGNQLTLVLDL